MSVKIITDSTSDILLEDAYNMGVDVVPLKVIIGEEEYRDGIDISKEAFFERLAGLKTLPTTTQPSPDEFARLFEKTVEEELVVITIGSGVSGTCQSATIAAAGIEGKQIYIVDSQMASVGLGILVRRAVELRDQGLSGAAIAARLDEEKQDIVLMAIVNNITNLYKSGRMGRGTMILGSMLGIKPIVTLKPHGVEAIGKERGAAKAYKFVKDTVSGLGELDESRPCALGYVANAELVDSFRDVMGKQWCPKNMHVDAVGSAIGTHLGGGALVYVYFKKHE